ncbi:hypothetical protein HK405_013283, partial [Cladochytrium tenue]
EVRCAVCGLEVPTSSMATVDAEDTRRRDEAYRLGFVIGAFQSMQQPQHHPGG